MDTITIKIYRETCNKLKQAHAKDAGKRKKVIPFIQFCDEVIIDGLRAKGYKRFNHSRTGS